MGTLTKPIDIPTQDILYFVFPQNVVPEWQVISQTPPDEVISVPGYTDAELSAGYQAYLDHVVTLAQQEAAQQAGEAQEMVSILQSAPTAVSLNPTLYTASGRLQLSKNDWYTGASPFYGYGGAQHNRDAGSGATPDVDWKLIGLPLPAGRRLGNFHISGYTSSSSIEDIEFYICLKAASDWQSGAGHSADVLVTPLYQDRFLAPSQGVPFTGKSNKLRWRTISLDYEAISDSMFLLFARAWNYTKSSRKYFYHAWALEVF